MWIFDLIGSAACVVVVMTAGVIVLRKYIQLKHPDPSLEEEIEYFENLNARLKQQEDIEWEQQLAQ